MSTTIWRDRIALEAKFHTASRSVELPKHDRGHITGNQDTQWVNRTWASRRYKSGLTAPSARPLINKRPNTTCYPIRSCQSNLSGNSLVPLKNSTRNTLSTRQAQYATNSGKLCYQGRRSKITTGNESKSRNLLNTTGSIQNGCNKSTQRVYPVSSRVYITDRLLSRDLAIRSLQGNPKLLIGQRNKDNFRPRPRSPPTYVELETALPVLVRQNTTSSCNTVITPSKAGYHPRSLSPTYRILTETKEFLLLALSKKIHEIRRDLDGMKARKNSAVFNDDPVSSEIYDTSVPNDWYVQMFDDTLQDDKVMSSELDIEDIGQSNAAIETTTLIRNLQFSAECLRLHINDSDILQMNIDEIEKKITERRDADRKQKKHVYDVQPTGTTPDVQSKFMKRSPGRPTVKQNLVFPRIEKNKFHVIKSNKEDKDTVLNYDSLNKETNLKNEKEQILEENNSLLKNVHQITVLENQYPQQPADSSPGRESFTVNTDRPILSVNKTDASAVEVPVISNVSVRLGVEKLQKNSDARISLITKASETSVGKAEKKSKEKTLSGKDVTESNFGKDKIKHNNFPDIPSDLHSEPVPKTDLNELSRRLLRTSIQLKSAEVEVATVIPPVDEKKPLTEKEKFLVMRKRMEDRKVEQSKKKEMFRDISMLGLSFDNQRARRGKLGSILSSKIDGMLAFGDDDESDDDVELGIDGSLLDSDEEPSSSI